MAKGNRTIEVRVDAETRDRWKRLAEESRCSLSEFIRAAVSAMEDRIAMGEAHPQGKASAVRSIHTGGKRTYQPDPK